MDMLREQKEHLDLKQEPHSTATPILVSSNPRPRFDIHWLVEFLGLLCSGVALGSIVILLNHYDRRPQPDWHRVSLNTVVAWLSTFAKACVLFPVTIAISQLKWSWFVTGRRPLSALQTFDAASRGVLGSLHFLWAIRFAQLASIGCVVTILAIGFEPFIQNLIHYYPRSVVDDNLPAYLANTALYRAYSPGNQLAQKNIYVDPLLKANVYNALLNTDESQPWATPKFLCSTGNCTWTDITTFYVQPSCHDLTPQLVTSCNHDRCTVGIRDGPSLVYTTSNASTKTTYDGMSTWVKIDPGSTADTKDALPLLSQIQYVMLVDGPAIFADPKVERPVFESSTFVGTSCRLDLCTQLVDVDVRNSIYSEVQKKLHCDRSAISTADRTTNITLPRISDASDSGTTTELQIDPFSYVTTAIFLTNLFAGYVSTSGNDTFSTAVQDWGSQIYDVHTTQNSRRVDNPYAVADVIEAIWYGNISRCTAVEDHLTCAFTNIAKAMTKSLRDSAFTTTAIGSSDSNQLDGLDNGSFGKLAAGNTHVVTTFVRIDWWWISLPCLVWAMSVVLWVGMMAETWLVKAPAWRDNTLPLLYLLRHPIDGDSAAGSEVSNRSLRRRSKAVHTSLRVDSGLAYLD